MLRVTLEQWRMFRSVVQFGGFNQASQGIHKSQSSIHNAVGKIESSLAVKLFEIEGRKTILTEAGELMLRRANFLLDEAAKLEVVGHTLGQGTEGSLRIAVDEIFPQMLLYKVLETISAQFPSLQIINDKRWVHSGKYVTSGGISAGIDMSLYLVSQIENQALADDVAHQMEYRWVKQ